MSNPSRKDLKRARHLLKHGRKWLWVQRDVLNTQKIELCHLALERLKSILDAKTWQKLPSAVADVEKQFDNVKPHQKFAVWKENFEAIFVALVIAGAIRTYFVLPFKIPTGSMQPTLYGVHPNVERGEYPKPYESGQGKPDVVSRFIGIIFWGRTYLNDGYYDSGDRIFVDRFFCNFIMPKRADVIVFRTRNLPDSYQRQGADFYVKRLVGLPNEKIQIRNGKLYVDDSLVDSPPVFKKIYNSPDYSGYKTVEEVGYGRRDNVQLYSEDQSSTVSPHGLFVFGDNTRNSVDSRYWGEFPRADLIGRAFMIYWPLMRIRTIE